MLADAGAQVAPSAHAAVGQADIVVSMPPASRHVEGLFLGAEGIIGCTRPGGVMDNVPASRGYTGGFGVNLMLKDLGLAAESAMAAKSPVPLGELARNLHALHSGIGAGELDFSNIVQLLQSKKEK